MVIIEGLLEPSENVLKKGVASHQWKEGLLYLTNRHLLFSTGVGLVLKRRISVKIPLGSIRQVESGGLPNPTITIHADKKYGFGGTEATLNTKKWLTAIEEARRTPQPSAPAGGEFCTRRGSPTQPSSRFCVKCGAKIL